MSKNNVLKASVVIAFYNNIKALKLVIRALETQSIADFEVVIADDGSNSTTVEQLEVLQQNSHLQIQHVWHEDKGFRKNRCLNLAVQAAKNEYLIFIDGDCVPQTHFVEDHLSEAQLGRCLNGRRADLSPKMTQILFKTNQPAHFVKSHLWQLLWNYVRGGGKNIEKGIRIPSDKIRKYLQKKNKGIVGCNFSLHKSDLLSINGFDKRYEAAGTGEDSDVEYRLRLVGIEIHPLFYKATQVHIYHSELPRSSENDALFTKIKAEKKAWTEFGIN
ncbi:glycosyltransferase [Agarivorans sp. B2Z047]|uniref:glycosyltransferase n=1 Tax=Agarivorans sp. B2Z047 TaxID=2652721 RepID=UPI00128CC6BC|nr:glycosyltransferase [Agarivorans sp. B2Z047]MPW31305.1 glycosyltransferase [Agarivorans sp. B2Z047]UQN42731.1 glycosyltransferase [Agarivorans sp. B2Z047]